MDFARDLESWLDGKRVSAYRENIIERYARWRKKHRGLARVALATVSLAICALIAFSVSESKENQRHLKRSASYAATTLENDIESRWAQLRFHSRDQHLVDELQASRGKVSSEILTWLVKNFSHYDRTYASSWFVCDDQGVMLARLPHKEEVEGKPWWHRDYFHGRGRDLPLTLEGERPKPIERPHLSAVFRSKADRKLKVCFSVPIKSSEGQVLGILAMSVHLNDFRALRDGAMLVDLRNRFVEQTYREGLILHYPQAAVPQSESGDSFQILSKRGIDDLQSRCRTALRSGDSVTNAFRFNDPISGKRPLVAAAPVRFRLEGKPVSFADSMSGGDVPRDSEDPVGWVIITK